ncbi:hypothetical protein [Dictyobacter arantiisoli]|uniref:Uncharacterized protein n=1 Tax=Dictyobacter arantiisoli TaxID=2014874 RepID=A0A5A5T727_9CHLR|nr:hypothetical protein [Dictyobacter arantiisoli]GCF07055.1 hypothetical protein KDI_06190 [Dictyobacter arantiisoli]
MQDFTNLSAPISQAEINRLFERLTSPEIEQFYNAYQLWSKQQQLAQLQIKLQQLRQSQLENEALIQLYTPSAVALAALAQFRACGVDDVEILDRMLARGETWLDHTAQLLQRCEGLDLIGGDYTQWCIHALEGAYEWMDSMDDAHLNDYFHPTLQDQLPSRVPDQNTTSSEIEEKLVRKLMSDDHQPGLDPNTGKTIAIRIPEELLDQLSQEDIILTDDAPPATTAEVSIPSDSVLDEEIIGETIVKEQPAQDAQTAETRTEQESAEASQRTEEILKLLMTEPQDSESSTSNEIPSTDESSTRISNEEPPEDAYLAYLANLGVLPALADDPIDDNAQTDKDIPFNPLEETTINHSNDGYSTFGALEPFDVTGIPFATEESTLQDEPAPAEIVEVSEAAEILNVTPAEPEQRTEEPATDVATAPASDNATDLADQPLAQVEPMVDLQQNAILPTPHAETPQSIEAEEEKSIPIDTFITEPETSITESVETLAEAKVEMEAEAESTKRGQWPYVYQEVEEPAGEALEARREDATAISQTHPDGQEQDLKKKKPLAEASDKHPGKLRRSLAKFMRR